MKHRKKLELVVLAMLFSAGLLLLFRSQARRGAIAVIQRLRGRRRVEDCLAQYGPGARERLAPDLKRIGVAYPPDRLLLVALKKEKLLEVWAASAHGKFRLLTSYPILAASGELGPKRKEGDHQVPEGLYRIESLNPNSMFHLSLRVNYPNAFDRKQGRRDGREQLGSDIMIHGSNVSVGCLAIGDSAVEELFVLVAETGIDHVQLIISPVDFRVRGLPADRPAVPPWTCELYENIRRELKKLPPTSTEYSKRSSE